MTIEFSIVGLVNYIDKDKLNDFYGSAPGKDVIIKLEPGNVYDPRAVVTLLNGKVIGHVRKADVSDKGLFTLLTKESRHTYNAKILHKADGYESLVAQLEYDGQLTPEVDLQEAHKNWKYTGIVLPPVPEWSELEDVMDSIMTLLERKTATADNLQPLMEKFFRLVRYGFSKEFFDDRKKLYTMLKKHDDERLRSYAVELEKASAEIHDHAIHAKAFGEIAKQMKKKIAKDYASDALNYVLSELNREMATFPSSDLYEARKKIKYFPSRLYYEQMPREVLLMFVSGLALCGYLGEIANKGKAKVKKKPGRSKKEKVKDPLRKRIVGSANHRDYWMNHIKEHLDGKDNARAGYVMRAYVDSSVLDSAPYGEVKATFGNIGTEELYNKGFKNVETKYEGQFNFLCEQIEADKKKLLVA